MSFVLYGSSLRCRSVLNQLFVDVNFTPWRWKPSWQGASKLSWPEIISLLSYQLVSRSHWSIDISCLLLPLTTRVVAYWYCQKKKKKKRSGSRSLRFSLSTRLSNYAAFFLVEKKEKKKKEEGQREDLPAAEKTDICAFWYKPFGLHFVSSTRSESRSFLFIRGEEIYVRKATNDGSTWRFILVARHAATLGLWRAIPRVGELPFLKGFSLWTDQSERVYFYWPPGPNPVVAISTRVGPGSRLTKVVSFFIFFPRAFKETKN